MSKFVTAVPDTLLQAAARDVLTTAHRTEVLMCYSAQVVADYRKFVRSFGAIMDIQEFARLFFERAEGVSKATIPKAMEDSFVEPHDEAERGIHDLIARFASMQATKFEQELFKPRDELRHKSLMSLRE